MNNLMKVICDFDGTTAINDVGNLLFRTFADARCYDIVREWKEGRINSRECLQQECSIASVSRQQLEAFADSQQLDPDFPQFVQFCAQRNIQVAIASDGLDFYIERILKNHSLDGSVAAHANALVFEPDNKISADFPYFEAGCGKCGNCKGYHVRAAKSSHGTVVYIGDGMSDRCGAEAADIVFAKRGRALIRFCRERGIEHVPFDDFSEVLIEFEKLLAAPKSGE